LPCTNLIVDIDVNDAFCDESDDERTSADQSLEDIAPNSKETPPQPTTNAQEFGEFAGERLALKLRSAIEQLFAEFHGRSEGRHHISWYDYDSACVLILRL
jgi:hypothetical protein